MEIGDRVKVVRVDDYTRDVCAALGVRTSIGLVGIVTEMYYNKNMSRNEVVVDVSGDLHLFEPWQLSVIRK